LIEYATIYHSNLFNSRGASASTAVVLVWKISVLLSNDEYDIIKKIISKSVNFVEPVLYI